METLPLHPYYDTLLAVFVLLAMVFVQALVASIAHRKQEKYVPGIVDEKLGPESFVFRSHRTFMNSIENVPFMVALVFVGIFMVLPAKPLAIMAWAYVAARLGHMVLYYVEATRKNPSKRSYFFMLGWLAQLALFGWCAVSFF